MQISAVSAVGAIAPTDRHAALGARAAAGAETKEGDAASKMADAAKTEVAKKERAVFQPAPPIRPNVQDTVDIDRALLKLRQV